MSGNTRVCVGNATINARFDRVHADAAKSLSSTYETPNIRENVRDFYIR